MTDSWIIQTSLGGTLMDYHIVQPLSESPVVSDHDQPSAEAPVPATTHPILSRLMDEVRNERQVEARYDRAHNRHNRGR